MRESYRDKQNRKSRISKEKQEGFKDRRKGERRSFDDRRNTDRRKSERRTFDDRNETERQNSSERIDKDRRVSERRTDNRRSGERRSFNDRRNSSREGFNERNKSPRNNFNDRNRTTRDNFSDRKFDRDIASTKIEKEVIDENEYDDVVAGRNAVLELLKSNKDINKIFVERGEKHGSINEIIGKAKEARIVLVEVDKVKLDTMTKENHQGVVAIVPPFNYSEVDEILEDAKNKNEDPFILILDGIEDPHNLGSIIRTAETAGVHGIIIPKRRTVAVNSTVAKVSTGATAYVKIARVNNLNDTIRKLKEAGLWIIGTDGDAKTMYYNQDLKGPLAIVIGSEGFGMSKLVKENTDMLIKIPMKGKITSLNASVSAGIVIYEAVKQRM